ncbi:MAG: DUF2017 family protein [Actinomycetota bacterium]|nr:DUF2017 family protein [Actinomycetota bacterium]
MSRRHGPIGRLGPNLFENRLEEAEVELLSILPDVVSEAMEMNSPYVARLFPPTYPFEPESQKEFDSLIGESLIERHRGLLSGFTSTLRQKHLNHNDLATWVGAINDIRLVLGSALEVFEGMEDPDESDPQFQDYMIYNYLSWLQGSILDFLSEQFSDQQ